MGPCSLTETHQFLLGNSFEARLPRTTAYLRTVILRKAILEYRILLERNWPNKRIPCRGGACASDARTVTAGIANKGSEARGKTRAMAQTPAQPVVNSRDVPSKTALARGPNVRLAGILHREGVAGKARLFLGVSPRKQELGKEGRGTFKTSVKQTC